MNPAFADRAELLFREHERQIYRDTDRLFAGILAFQWLVGIGTAVWVSPRTWYGTVSKVHLHVWEAIFLGGVITLVPALLAWKRPGEKITRYWAASAQMLFGALLIHLTGGRIETHFHVFGSLAIVAFYRDWKVLVPATVIVALDHWLRGMYWPQSVYGVVVYEPWRWLEHAMWVVIEDAFLIASCVRSKHEMREIAERSAQLEKSNQMIESQVARRTAELQKSRADLVTKTELLYNVLSTIPHCVFWKDTDLVYRGCNENFANFAGFEKPSDVIGKTDDQLFGKELAEVYNKTDREILASKRSMLNMEEEYKKDGRQAIILLKSNVALRDPGGSVIGVLGVFSDISDRKRIEAKLSQVQKMDTIGTLAAGIAHDLNNQLTPIAGYTDLLIQQLRSDHPSYPLLAEMEQATHRCRDVVQKLMNFSRNSTLERTTVSLAGMLDQLKGLLSKVLPATIHVDVSHDPDLWSVRGNETELHTVFMNLATNARDAMPSGGQLKIKAANVVVSSPAFKNADETGEYVCIKVRDSGSGIAEEIRTKIFEPFFTTKPKGKGVGLGLSMVFKILQEHQGWIDVNSDKTGTEFNIYLPADHQAVRTGPRPAPDTALPIGHETILFADDDEPLRNLGKLFLEKLGYKVLLAQDGEEAVRVYNERHREIDAVVLDMTMPKMTGRQVLEYILGVNPSAKVLLASGYTAEGSAKELIEAGAKDYLAKPYTIAPLSHRLRKMLDLGKP